MGRKLRGVHKLQTREERNEQRRKNAARKREMSREIAQSHPDWYIADVDDGILAVVATKQEALEWCKNHTLDSRKTAKLHRYGKQDFYEYRGPSNVRLTTYDVGTRWAMVQNGYDEAIKAHEEGRPYNDSSMGEWNILSSPQDLSK